MTNIAATRIALIPLLLVLLGCSVSNPASQLIDSPDHEITISGTPGRLLLGAWHIIINPVDLTANALMERRTQTHFNVTQWLFPPQCDDCVKIQVLEYKPVQKRVVVRTTLKNPTGLTAHDVRGILMTENRDIRLLNADSYTNQWDNGWDVTINPFKAFAVDIPQRAFSPGASHSREYDIRFPTPDKLTNLYLILDASWPGNCREPYEITNQHATGVFLDYEKHNIQCEVLSWNDDIESVTIDLGCLGGDEDTAMVYSGGNLWVVENLSWRYGGMGPGSYRAPISAKCAGSPIHTYNYVDITVDASQPATGWARTWGGTAIDNAHRVEVDASGNIFVSGTFSVTVDFDPGPDIEEHTSNGGKDAFVIKLNPDGSLLWARTFGGPDDDTCYGLDTDSSGAVFISGAFAGEVDFDPGPGTDIHSPNGWMDAYVVKFSTDGEFQWAHTWGGDDSVYYDFSHGLTVDDSGCVYVTGKTNGTIDFDPGPGIDEYTSAGLTDAYMVKFDTDGNYQWARVWGGAGMDKVRDIVTDGLNYIYVTGLFNETVDFDPGPELEEHASNGEYDIYLSKFNTNGDFIWTRCWGCESPDESFGIDVTDAGGIYITGYFKNTVDFNPGAGIDEHTSSGHEDIFLSVIDVLGNYHGCITWGGIQQYDYGYDVVVDDIGNIYVAGRFVGTADFDPGPGVDENTSNGVGDAFLCKFNPTGGLQWTRPWGGENTLSADFGYGIAIDNSGHIYVSGGFLATPDFQPGPGTDTRTSNGSFDAFICKFNSSGMW